MAEKKEKIKIQTPEFRASFPQVFEARAFKPGDKAKFSIQMLFQVEETPQSKKDGCPVVSIENLKGAVRKILFDKFGENWKAEIARKKPDGAPMYKLPFRDGAEKYDMVKGQKVYKPGYGPGIVFCTASSVQKPGVVYPYAGPDGVKPASMTVQTDLYGGCYARATVNPYWFDYMSNLGVALGLQNVQKMRDGEPLGGRSNPEDDFDAIPDPGGATAAAGGAGTQAGGTPPAPVKDPLGL